MKDGSHVERGRHAESLAAAFLALRGYAILERNFRYSRLEVDLVARRDRTVVFVEVKFRERPRLGGAVGAVNRQKQLDIETAAVGYLRVRELRAVKVRFDVVVIEPAPGRSGALLVRHLPNAFPASGRYRL